MGAPIPAPVTSDAPSPLAAMMNVFVDPAASVRVIPRSYSWLWPILLHGTVSAALGYLSVPTVLRVMQLNPPGGVTAQQLEQSMGMMSTMYRVGSLASPLIIAGFMALLAALLLVTCSMAGIRAKFRDLYSLLAYASLIGLLQTIAGFVVVRLKGDEIQTMEELQPAFGLALIFHEGLSKVVIAILNYFSVFTIWYIAVLVIALAAWTKASKTKAFFVSIPVWLIPMLFAVAGAMFRK